MAENILYQSQMSLSLGYKSDLKCLRKSGKSPSSQSGATSKLGPATRLWESFSSGIHISETSLSMLVTCIDNSTQSADTIGLGQSPMVEPGPPVWPSRGQIITRGRSCLARTASPASRARPQSPAPALGNQYLCRHSAPARPGSECQGLAGVS